MTNFEDVYNNYEDVAKRYGRLKVLLINKLKKYDVSLTSEENFQELIHKVPNILTNEYDITGNIQPTDAYVDISTLNLSTFNETLVNRTLYYIKWLRYYLALKGVDLNRLNHAKTLEDHILLIDFMDRIKKTTISVILNNDDNLYYGDNIFYINVIDDEGVRVFDGDLIIYKDGVRYNVPNTYQYVITTEDLNEHNYSFQYAANNSYQASNVVNFTLTTQPMPITFTATLSNQTLRQYINQDDILKGYKNDDWVIETYTTDINNKPINISKIIKIYDNEPYRILETLSYQNYIEFQKYNYENNNEPIKVTVEVENSSFYDFNTQNIELYANILTPYYQITPLYDYTSKEHYEFTINFYDELTGEPTAYFDNYNININFTQEENDYINTSLIINNHHVTIEYNNNLLAFDYNLEWEIPELYISNTDIISILPNIMIENNIIYLTDEPKIKILNNVNISDLIVCIIQNNEDFDDEIYYFPLMIDDDNYIILPDEYKQEGSYFVRIENYNTQEECEFTYTIRAPYYYISTQIHDQQIFNIHIYDTDDFNINDITNYIKICEYGRELEYQYQNDNYLTIIADATVNPDFKGINKFWININGYEQTEEFQLLPIDEIITNINEETGEEEEEIIYGKGYEILNDIELGINNINIACYKWNIDHIDVAVIHNGNTTNYSLDSDNEDFFFTHDFATTGNYTITITDSEETVTFDIIITKLALKIQDFRFKDEIQSNETPTALNSLGFGFAENNNIDDDINIIFYYDNPNNILTTKTINAQDSQYHIYTDIKLEDLSEGPHTIYASYNGGLYYDSFVVSKDIYRLGVTRIVYDEEFDSIDIGESIELSLLTLDSHNTVINDGYYIYNGNTYGMHENIVIEPPIVDDHYLVTIYYEGGELYENASVTINYTIRGDIYDYYASSRIGDNTNNGVYPTTPVQDVDILFNISQPEDLLCLMAGEYIVNTISRNANLYGYHKHNYQDIKLTCYYLAANTTLRLKNVLLDTGNGFTFIEGLYEFVNSSNQRVSLSSVPGHPIIPSDDEVGTYDIDTLDIIDIVEGETATINGIVTKNDIPIEGKLIKIYKDGIIIKGGMSLSDGSFTIPLDINNAALITVEVTNSRKQILIRKTIKKNLLLNGNEELIQIRTPNISIIDNELINGGTGYIVDTWRNSAIWEIEFDMYTTDTTNGNAVIIIKNGVTTRDTNVIKIQSDKNVYIFYNGPNNNYSTHFTLNQPVSNDAENPNHVKISKIDDNTIKFNVDEDFEFIQTEQLFAKFFDYDWCIGIDHWNGSNKIHLKNIRITEVLSEVEYYTNNIQKIKIDDTQELAKTQSNYPIIMPLIGVIKATKQAESGYLIEGFKNTQFWEVTCQAKCTQNSGVAIYKKGTTSYDYDCAIAYYNGRLDTLNGNTRWSGYEEKTSPISDEVWTDVTIKKISSKVISLTVGDGPEIKTGWYTLPTYEELCIGPQSWGGTVQIKNIEVKNIIEEEV